MHLSRLKPESPFPYASHWCVRPISILLKQHTEHESSFFFFKENYVIFIPVNMQLIHIGIKLTI